MPRVHADRYIAAGTERTLSVADSFSVPIHCPRTGRAARREPVRFYAGSLAVVRQLRRRARRDLSRLRSSVTVGNLSTGTTRFDSEMPRAAVRSSIAP